MSVYKYKQLYEPIKLGRTLFRNRIFSAPQDIYRLTSENFLDESATAFYEVKAMGGFASVCLGDVMVDTRAGHSHPFQLRGDDVKVAAASHVQQERSNAMALLLQSNSITQA